MKRDKQAKYLLGHEWSGFVLFYVKDFLQKSVFSLTMGNDPVISKKKCKKQNNRNGKKYI